MKIRQKLIFGFLAVAALVLAAGLVGIFSSRAISRQADIILMNKVPLKDLSMEAQISLQKGANAAAEYMLHTGNLKQYETTMRNSIDDFDMWISMMAEGSDSPEFRNSPAGKRYIAEKVDIVAKKGTPEIIAAVNRTDQFHEAFAKNADELIKNHREMQKYTFTYSGKNWDFINFFTLVELQHKKWIEQLFDAATSNKRFTGETDPRKCFFGQWYYSYSIQDPEMEKLLKKLEPYHNALHQGAKEINAASGSAAKMAIYEGTIVPIKNEINKIFTEIQNYIGPKLDKISKQENLELDNMNTALEKAQNSLSDLETVVDQDMRTAMDQADRTQQIGLIALIAVSIVGILLALIIGIPISLNIARPLARVTEQSSEVALGNLDTEKITVKTKDEIKQLSDAFNLMIDSFRTKAAVVDEIAGGNLTVDIEKASERDGLGLSLIEMRDSLHELIRQVNTAIGQVASGSEQVSMASQSLSQGATEQASSLEEISSSLTQVNGQAKENAQKASEATKLAQKATSDAEQGNEQMKDLVSSMERINSSSDEINKIVKVIDDIAFQINLLALNANVEAARAGKYGKGFAVVAEEVRNLAVRSAEAVQETTNMVGDTIKAIKEGNQTAEDTAKQLEEIVVGSTKVASFLSEIAAASNEQAQAIEQITEGLDQIDQVTQSNTASAEESASASEELASQAQQMKAMIARFNLKQEEDLRLEYWDGDEEESEDL